MLTDTQRVAIVTGGTRGIGAAITTTLAQDGIRVAAAYVQHKATATEFGARMEAAGLPVSIHQVNVANPADCQRLVDEVLNQYGRVDYLVNNAAINRDRTAVKLSILDWQQVINTNLSGPFYMAKALLPHMLERGFGRIVNISSFVGQTGNFGQVNYAAAKSGLFGMTKVLALETAQKGITVNCIAPGAIETEMSKSVPPEMLQAVIDRVPQKRMGCPEEVAFAVRMLLDDKAAHITGATVPVNGGLVMI